MKCFNIKTDQVYDRNQFYFSNERQVLRINFSYTPGDKKERIVLFMTKSKETAEFSKIINLEHGWRGKSYQWFPGYEVTSRTSLYKVEDRFSFIRRHFSSSQEGEASDANAQLLVELQPNEFNLTTLNLPIQMSDYELEVDEDLMDQFLKQKNQNKQTNLNSQRLLEFAENSFKREINYKSDFSFNLNFIQKIVSSTNEENFSKLILGLLNVLFIWLDLGVLELHSVFLYSFACLRDKINQFCRIICKYLNKLKLRLYKSLCDLKKNSPRDRQN